MSAEIPRSIPQLWNLIDRRLTVLEQAQAYTNKQLDDHEQRLRTGNIASIIAATVNSFVSLAAILKVLLR